MCTISCVGTVSGIVSYTHFKMAEQREEKKRSTIASREQAQDQEKQFQLEVEKSESQELLVNVEYSESKTEKS